MSAGLPLLVLSALSVAVVAAWVSYGSGSRSQRLVIGAIFLVALALCWGLLLSFGPFQSVGSNAMAGAFLVAVAGFVVPVVWRKVSKGRRHG
jgi:hypothetical protein